MNVHVHHRPQPMIQRTSTLVVAGVLAAWSAAIVAIAAADGFVVDSDSPPWPVLLAAATPVVAFVALLRTPIGQAIVDRLDPQVVLAVQLWRVVGAAFLFGWAAGDLDAGFAIPAGIGDIATGVAALVVVASLRSGSFRRRHLVAFTALGVGDFATAVVTGIVVGPTALEELPWVLFPTLAVPFFSMIHILNWLQLRTEG